MRRMDTNKNPANGESAQTPFNSGEHQCAHGGWVHVHEAALRGLAESFRCSKPERSALIGEDLVHASVADAVFAGQLPASFLATLIGGATRDHLLVCEVHLFAPAGNGGRAGGLAINRWRNPLIRRQFVRHAAQDATKEPPANGFGMHRSANPNSHLGPRLATPFDGLIDLAQRRQSGVGDVAVDELGKPGMADLGPVGYVLPITPAGLQDALDLLVQGFVHSPILVKDSWQVKEQITRRLRHPRDMPEKSINEVVAENLAYWMGQAGMSQTALAEKAGVSQKTISNYLNPGQRTEGSTGKQPSAKLTELDRIARALSVQVWQLTREMSERERKLYEAIEKAYNDLRESSASATKDESQVREMAEPPSAKRARKKLASR